MKFKHLFLWCIGCLLLPLQSCNDLDDLEARTGLLNERVAAIEKAVDRINESVNGLQYLLSGTTVVGVTAIDKGYKIELADGTSFNLVSGEDVDGLMPQIKINEEGHWMYSVDGTTYFPLTDKDGKPLTAIPTSESGEAIKSPQMQISADGYWQVSYDQGTTYTYLLDDANHKVSALVQITSSNSIFDKVFYDENGKQELVLRLAADGREFAFPVINNFYLKITDADTEQLFLLADTRTYQVEQSQVKEALIQAPEGWKVVLEETQLTITAPSAADADQTGKINIIITSPKNYIRTVTIPTKLMAYKFGTSPAWLKFETGAADNVLVDFSYAGYSHGEVAPPFVSLTDGSYTVYNVKDYGATGDGVTSDRASLLKIIELIKRPANAKAIIYFPQGEYVLHTKDDDKDGVSQPIEINFGGFVLKGDGRDKTFLKMVDPNVSLSSSTTPPAMLNLKHTVGIQNPIDVTGTVAEKGTFSIQVADATQFSVGQWVCLNLKDNSPALIQEELTSKTANGQVWTKTADATWTDLINNGVQVYDYHQIAKKSGNTITFAEPLMHKVDPQWKWQLYKFNYYENVGVEDLTFVGNTQLGYLHHGNDYADDNDYKPIGMMRLVNSWMRRVNFTSVSEALSISNSANISVYDIEINGNRGHSSIRSGGSSRVFIGKVKEHSRGYIAVNESTTGNLLEDAGQLHASGISKQSLGTVIWNVSWGQDACFEAHATQPRATLIDVCSGAFIKLHQGGAMEQLPNHLDDLIIWNFNATNTNAATQSSFTWWGERGWTAFMPPVIVGFHGSASSQIPLFKDSEVKLIESYGTAVTPGSLYEAQLKKRLGYVPGWLNALK